MKSVSVIIPAYNEQEHIASCLKAIRAQSNLVKEIIIADHSSRDETRAIAIEMGARVVDGGRPAVGRNAGAEAANGEYLLFVDADTILPPEFLTKSIAILEKGKIGIASFFLKPLPYSVGAAIVFSLYNLYGWLASRLNCPVFNTAGCCLLVRREWHEKVGGFDERMVVLEEYDYIRRIKWRAPFRVMPLAVKTSVRRFSGGKSISRTIHLFRYYFQWLMGKKIEEDRYGYWQS